MKTAFKSRAWAAVLLAGSLSFQTVLAADAGTGESFKGPIGLQLYSLREQFASDGVPATLEVVKGFGIKRAELAGTYGKTPEEFKNLLDQFGITPVSGHFSYELFRDHPEQVVVEASTLGLKYAGVAWIPHQGDFTEADAREAAKVFNHAGEALARSGIQFFYHCHGYEFQPSGDGTLFDLLMKETDPKKVAYQMDVFWVVYPGQDPVKLLEKYPGRWKLMHVKDLKKGVVGDLSGGTKDLRNDVTIGTGRVDWSAVLAAAENVGVREYFIEDESPTSVQQIPNSLKYLEQVRF